MSTKQLQRNVKVDGTWYGPAYPENPLTADVRKKLEGNPLAFVAPARADAVGTPFGPRVAGDDIGAAADPGATIVPMTEADRPALEALSRDDLVKLAEARDVDVARSASKAEIIDRLTGRS